MEQATLGAGCFWHPQDVFMKLEGVQSAIAGYAGGNTNNPTYEQVCSGSTNHAEVVHITFDPAIITYAQLLKIFFTLHDPTTPNQQGPNVGTQYRSIILYHSKEQEKVAKEHIQTLVNQGQKIITHLEPFTVFYPAEEYHQEFFKKRNISF